MSAIIESLLPVYDVPGAAKVLGITPRTLYSWVYAGKVETIKLGRLLRIRGDEVARLIDEGLDHNDFRP